MYGFFKKIVYGALYGKGIVKYVIHHKSIRFLLRSLNSKTHGYLLRKLAELLAELQKGKIKEALDLTKKTVAIFSVSGAYKEHVGGIANKLQNKNYNVLIFYSMWGKGDDEYEKQKNVFYVLDDVMGNMDFVDVLICVAHSNNLPVNVKKVLFVHDIHDSPLGDIDKVSRLILEFDYFFLPSHYVVNRIKQLVSTGRDKCSRDIVKNKEVCLIPGGYIKLDRNLEYFEEYKQDAKILIYAPTITTREGLEDLVSVPQYGDEIIEAILNNFTDYDLIFRPHPSSLYTAEVENIAKKYRNHPRFTLDDNASFYRDNYSKSALMITDMSGTAYTYAFTTLRPVIFFSPDESEVKKRCNGFKFFDDRSKIGYIAENIDELVEKIKLLLTSRDEFSLRIKEYRDSLIYNIGKSEDYFVDNFEYIIEDKKHPDWEYL